jgi:phosphoribosylanthranilate isomerase
MRIAQLPFVKICCISSVDEARLAVAAGASALGLVSAMPSGPGVIAQQLIAQIASSVPPPVATFLLTSHRDADEIILQHRECGTNTIQLVDQVPLRQLEKLRRKLPGIKLVQVVHVTGLDSIGEADAVAPFVDALLLDSGNPALPIKELGGTGRTHDWNLSRRICSESKVPVFLAGGLNATNVALAISSTQPFGLDLCSAVRTDGRLDADKLRDFFAVLRLLATS